MLPAFWDRARWCAHIRYALRQGASGLYRRKRAGNAHRQHQVFPPGTSEGEKLPLQSRSCRCPVGLRPADHSVGWKPFVIRCDEGGKARIELDPPRADVNELEPWLQQAAGHAAHPLARGEDRPSALSLIGRAVFLEGSWLNGCGASTARD